MPFSEWEIISRKVGQVLTEVKKGNNTKRIMVIVISALAVVAAGLAVFILTRPSMDAPKLSVGDLYEFGEYDGQKISWKVLAVEDDRALIISEHILLEKEYNKGLKDITWKECSLRSWLNGEFLDSCFTPEERSIILLSDLENPDNEAFCTEGGDDTKDRIFLLSVDEAEKYFADDDARSAGRPGRENNRWWLRTPGYIGCSAVIVFSFGQISDRGNYVNHDNFGVRPAMWIKAEQAK